METLWSSIIKGNIHKVIAILPEGTRYVSGELSGTSTWATTVKLLVKLPDGSQKKLFFKYAIDQGAEALTAGEYYSAVVINEALSGFVPRPVGKGKFDAGNALVYFFLGEFHDMDPSIAPEPASFMSKIATIHRTTSANSMFGFHVPTACGKMERTVTWEESWAKSFTHQLKDVIKYDNQTNRRWPEYDAACKQLIDVVIPRLLGALQSDGRKITPSLIHGDLWENNVRTYTETGEAVLFDPGCTYAHNEMEFGTWRCTWARYFKNPVYMEAYQTHIKPSEPVEEWDDRNRLYSIPPYLIDSAGHAGSASRKIAYNEMLYLCEKYGPLNNLEKYDPQRLQELMSDLSINS
ncbi:Fructosamine kinase-domain-containing protein [Hypoxylon rubiginosum]|uniref:Fructosamine kinase-domain-containing protein n=1 Tax=Hypoxylon rubiginosum TaxID=110542 RepID=A0ACC0CK68_9PEZI|nr:Fructosamine kinase-domain-containing protein [Hypoxylon rubiginosum]